ncbi:TPA: Cys-rich peptide radical SAM maturase CcpM [Clostridium botulinum]|uniref:Cys-rich peptide radical SAM maturase CcpM n=1 Tax=Clostridium TaxID=1485 RepID=UPI000774B8BD|nr:MULTISPECIES: Cys-rich peptide radical SAM maturase CcpM [Clostridium]AUM96123.1 Cys-rich peptide radical SAM maturase CcpM [Clostridium sporogenes]AVQ53572.1 Cys-rich peptide radical SAM maturase CcpM [Clostridium botulinum]HBJ2613235.1 Cys-rich peptide radical SAM maturase CcpM [Clostridium botulinum]HBJ2615634.1 Cys-rich peptide radical SAM maturase CcpM [Clostridium botulinum]
MNVEGSFIHLFKTRGGNYAYDVNTNSFLKISKYTYELLCKNMNSDSKEKQFEVIEDIKKEGFLSSNTIEEMVHPMSEVLSNYLDSSLSMLILQVTQQCNFRCKYCTYSGLDENRTHSNKDMGLDIAKKAIDFYIKHSRDCKYLNIGFYGGEPLLKFDFVKECVNYAKEKGEGKTVEFNMTTNGTLFNEERLKFLSENNFRIMISLDGPKEIHDKNRTFLNGEGTFDKIMKNIEMIKSKYPKFLDENIDFNAVIDGKSDVVCTNKFFINYDTVKDLKVRTSFVSDTYKKIEQFTVEEENMIKIGYERFKVLLWKLGKLDEKHVSKLFQDNFNNVKNLLHDKKSIYKKLNKRGHHGGPCIPGVTRLFVTVDGKFFPCEKVNEKSKVMQIGNISDGFDIEKIRNLMNVGKLTENKCKKCWAFRYCFLCSAFADDNTKLSKEKKTSRCTEVRASVDNMFKTYCTLKEFGYDFEEKRIMENV